MTIRQDCYDAIPDSPYVRNSQSDQEWRMGYVDGMDNDPCFGQKNSAYRQGYLAGRAHSEKFGK